MNRIAPAEQSLTYADGNWTACEAAPDGERILRRRFAATGIDLIMLYAGTLLLAQSGWTFALFPLVLFLMRDWGEGHSPGKRLFNLAACDARGRRCTLGASILRNITLLPPLLLVELALLLFSTRGTRLGDFLGSTVVQFREARASATAEHPASTSQIQLPDSIEGAAPSAPADHDPASDPFDAMIIDPGLLTPDAVTPEEIAEAEADATATPGGPRGVSPSQPKQLNTTAIDPLLAARCIGILGPVTNETLDAAYWRYVDQWSPDAVQTLSDGELHSRCVELAESKEGLPFDVPEPVDAGAGHLICMQYLNDWFVIINKCRDSLG